MKLSELVNYKSNKDYLEYISTNRANIVPFVGAGISKGCGLYTWKELLHKIAEDYFEKEKILALEKEDCFTFADAIIEAVGSSDYVMQRIRHIFSHQEVLQNEIPYLITSMFSPLVVTTNYDKLLEEASVNSPLGVLRPLLPCLTGQMNEAILLNERRLLKIHGSIEETTSFVFSSEQYKTAYGEKGNRENKFLPNLLYKIFTARAVLFIGCSLENDRTVEILEESVKNNPGISHFAILPYFADKSKQIKRNRELSKLHINPIFYPEGDYEAVNQILHFISSDNHFISSVRKILSDVLINNTPECQVILAILSKCFYKTSSDYPQLLDIDNIKCDFIKDISIHQADTILSICKTAFSAYVKTGFILCVEEVIKCFNNYLAEELLKETDIQQLLQKRWGIERNLTRSYDNTAWVESLNSVELNEFAINLLGKLQYKNGMSFIDVKYYYDLAKSLVEMVKEKIEPIIYIKLLNSIGAFGHYFKDFKTAILYLEKAIRCIDDLGDKSKDVMLLKAKCYANIAITSSLSNGDLGFVLNAAEKDIAIKKDYGESPIYLSRSLNFYATALKEIDPIKAYEVYAESLDIKKELIFSAKNDERKRELTASWATTLFNIGLLAKDLELYDIAYQIISVANQYRFMTVDYCNRDFCSSINVYAELELFVSQRHNIEWLMEGIETRCDLPDGFSGTLSHTWYVVSYYHFLKHEYDVAYKYANMSLSEANKKGALIDNRQIAKSQLLLASIKYSLNRRSATSTSEPTQIVENVVKRTSTLYGEKSFYLISAYRHLIHMVDASSGATYRNKYNELIDIYHPQVSDIENKLSQLINSIK